MILEPKEELEARIADQQRHTQELYIRTTAGHIAAAFYGLDLKMPELTTDEFRRAVVSTSLGVARDIWTAPIPKEKP